MSGERALAHARSAGRDMIQVSVSRPDVPTVVRLVDYVSMEQARRKKAFEKRKSEKETRKLQRREMALKQVRLSPATEANDLAMKVRQAKQFLIDGYRVKVFMLFRRGHGILRDAAKNTLIDVATELSNFGKIQGISQGATISDMFNPPKDDSDDETDDKDAPAVKKTPLEVLLYPLSRKDRALVDDTNTVDDDDNKPR